MANQPKKYKKFVATAATATLVASAIVPVASAKSFSDVPANNEFQPFIDALSDNGIINGYQDGTFKPTAKLTRGQVVKMLGRWVEANGQEAPSDWNSVQRFNDVSTNNADEELVKYAALVKDSGVFTGSNGNLMPNNNITRQQMAKVLNGAYEAVNGVSLVDLAEGIDDKLIQDLATSQQEFEGYIQALVDLEISTVSVFRPSENVTRAQFAKFLYNTINLDVAVSASVKAVNATTVEVTFDEEVGNVDDYKFEIEGLEIKNAAKKQSDAKTVVLTTAVQETGKEYTVSVNGEEVGSFVGVSAVIPTDINFVNRSIQAKNGEEVTVQAKVTVPDGQSKEGIPVTFNVYTGKNNDTAINPQIIGEATTNAEGVATYKYTRYNGDTDSVDAYATGAPSKKATAKVYWSQTLTIKDVTVATTLQNGAKKVYQVTGDENEWVYVTFEENLNVTPDKAVTKAKLEGLNVYNLNSDDKITNSIATGDTAYPFEFTTGGKRVGAIKLDATGKANIVVSGSNATVTPIVYSYGIENTSSPIGDEADYSATALQAKASKVTFQQTQILTLDLVEEGTANAAAKLNDKEIGGRSYVTTVKTPAGTPATNTDVYVAFKLDSTTSKGIEVYNAKNVKQTPVNTTNDTVYYKFTTDAKGEVKFTATNATENTFATPIVFVDNGDRTKVGVLDDADLQKTAGITYFSAIKPSDYTSKLMSTTSADTTTVVTSFGVKDTAQFAYQLSDQNGKVRSYSSNTEVTFQVTNTGGSAVVVDGNSTLQPGQTGTYNKTIFGKSVNLAPTDNQYKAWIDITSAGASSVEVIATPSNTGIALAPVSGTATFAGGSATPAFAVSPVTSVTTVDTVTFTFTEAISRENVTVTNQGGTTVATSVDASNNKVLYAYFTPALTVDNTFSVLYGGKVYTFKLDADGSFKLQ